MRSRSGSRNSRDDDRRCRLRRLWSRWDRRRCCWSWNRSGRHGRGRNDGGDRNDVLRFWSIERSRERCGARREDGAAHKREDAHAEQRSRRRTPRSLVRRRALLPRARLERRRKVRELCLERSIVLRPRKTETLPCGRPTNRARATHERRAMHVIALERSRELLARHETARGADHDLPERGIARDAFGRLGPHSSRRRDLASRGPHRKSRALRDRPAPIEDPRPHRIEVSGPLPAPSTKAPT